MRHSIKPLLLIMVGIVLAMSSILRAHQPTLFFGPSDIPALQAKVQQPEFAPIYGDILQKATAYCTPGSDDYVDPSDAWFQDGDYGWYGRDVQSWIEPIGFAYQLTGDSFYGQHGAAILAAAADYEAPPGSLLDKNIDMMRTLAVGYDWLATAMTPAQKSKIEQVAREYILWSQDNVWGPYHNFMGVGHGGTGLLAIAMRDAYPTEADSWVTFAKNQIITWFDEGFDAQGCYYEGHDYMQYGFSNALTFGDALLRNDGISIFNNAHLRQVPHYLCQIRLPGEDTYEGRNDSRYSASLDVSMLRLVSAWDDGLMRWIWDQAQPYWSRDYHLGGYSPLRILWSNSVTPTPVENSGEPLAEHCAGRGLVSFRTGWSDADTLLTMEAGPYYEVTHNQADKGHFGLYTYGQRFAADTIYGNNRDPQGRCQTVAHSCILVDGIGQALSGASYGTDGKILAYENNELYGYALADCTDAYNTNNHDQPGAVVEWALRHTIFMRPSGAVPAYAVILDDIKKDSSIRTYTWQLLSWTDMNIDLGGDQPVIEPRDYVTTPMGSSGTGACTWQVNIGSGGTHYIWAHAGGNNASDFLTQTDSFYVEVAGGPKEAWSLNGSWQLVDTHYSLFPEPFELKFTTRERGAKLFRVWVTNDAGATPPAADEDQGGILLLPDTAQLSAPMELVSHPSEMKLYQSAESTIDHSLDWYEPGDGRTPAGFPRLRSETDAVNPLFMSVLVPRMPEHAEPVVTFDQDSDPRVITVEWPEMTDTITWTGQTYTITRQHAGVQADINGDGVVNILDFADFVRDWMRCSDPANPNCVPADQRK